jgi:hypothetical protein
LDSKQWLILYEVSDYENPDHPRKWNFQVKASYTDANTGERIEATATVVARLLNEDDHEPQFDEKHVIFETVEYFFLLGMLVWWSGGAHHHTLNPFRRCCWLRPNRQFRL